MESYIYRNYYAPHAGSNELGRYASFAHISDLGIEWKNHDLVISNQAQAITIHGSFIRNKVTGEDFSFLQELDHFKNLQFLSLPMDFLSLINWEHEATRLLHLRIDNPTDGKIWTLFKEKSFPRFPSNIFQRLITLNLPCPSVNWPGFDIKNFPNLKWFAIELEEFDRTGASLKQISKNSSIIGYDLFDPKGHDVLAYLPVDIEALSIRRATSKKFDFSRLNNFRKLKYLNLIGSPTIFDVKWICNLFDLEELEIRSFRGIKNSNLLLDMSKLRYLEISSLKEESYMTDEEKTELSKKIKYCCLD